jgi:hypothetical protein
MSDPTTDFERNHRGSAHTEASFDAKRRELGVSDELKSIPGVTTLMLVAFGMQGIKSIEDLAGCATDDLHGWTEEQSGRPLDTLESLIVLQSHAVNVTELFHTLA